MRVKKSNAGSSFEKGKTSRDPNLPLALIGAHRSLGRQVADIKKNVVVTL